MPTPNMYPLLVILLLASPYGMIFTSFGISISEASNSKTLEECENNISIQCAREIGKSIFESGTVTEGCCYALVYLGKTCHDLFFHYSLAYKSNVNKSKALAKSTQVWNQCNKITISPTSFAF
ncbi:hypothetical protein PRUPE_2G072700 [Prunus persica]|uniref:Prolamin-like domain-containing protein n=1 Tax=Prunus persica TaxID=3760 RepID=A0A251QCN3_PRUPE|nr:hypothetical protein PRUPE_2G072700 [Prunus persica]